MKANCCVDFACGASISMRRSVLLLSGTGWISFRHVHHKKRLDSSESATATGGYLIKGRSYEKRRYCVDVCAKW